MKASQSSSSREGASQTQSKLASSKLEVPKSFIWATVAVCTLPAFLNLLGVDFASHPEILDLAAASQMETKEASEAVIRSLSGTYTHTILEWTATTVAFFTVVLAFTHFQIKRDVITPIIGIALFAAGSVDVFHTLAADRLITADQTDFLYQP